jgi:hypothetical protein
MGEPEWARVAVGKEDAEVSFCRYIGRTLTVYRAPQGSRRWYIDVDHRILVDARGCATRATEDEARAAAAVAAYTPCETVMQELERVSAMIAEARKRGRV